MIKLSKKDTHTETEDKIVDLLKQKLKKNKIVKECFDKYDVPINVIDMTPIFFKDLDVSAKTVDKVIFLNRKLLKTDITTVESYLVHELVHLTQQLTGNIKGHDKKEYLDKDTEQEAFKAQIKFKEKEEGKEEAEKYVDDLLDYHGLDGKKFKQKKKELMPK